MLCPSLQIARRSVQLAESFPSAWEGIGVDSFDDLVASKMVALIERGAPRDFRDIYMLCQSGRIDAARCWELWRDRQTRAQEDAEGRRAQLATRTHLARIEQARPLEEIADAAERAQAEKLRAWFVKEFLRELAD